MQKFDCAPEVVGCAASDQPVGVALRELRPSAEVVTADVPRVLIARDRLLRIVSWRRTPRIAGRNENPKQRRFRQPMTFDQRDGVIEVLARTPHHRLGVLSSSVADPGVLHARTTSKIVSDDALHDIRAVRQRRQSLGSGEVLLVVKPEDVPRAHHSRLPREESRDSRRCGVLQHEALNQIGRQLREVRVERARWSGAVEPEALDRQREISNRIVHRRETSVR
ncbi:MAG: hypothetical protein U0326_17205 [Polyangiales bacterium]